MVETLDIAVEIVLARVRSGRGFGRYIGRTVLSALVLLRRVAAIHDQLGARDVRRFVRCQEEHGVSYVER